MTLERAMSIAAGVFVVLLIFLGVSMRVPRGRGTIPQPPTIANVG
jgi:preprotein translocase subunit SecG